MENIFVVGEIYDGEGHCAFHAYNPEFSKKIKVMLKKWISEKESG